MGTPLRGCSESYPMNINMTGMVFENLSNLVHWKKVGLVLKWLNDLFISNEKLMVSSSDKYN